MLLMEDRAHGWDSSRGMHGGVDSRQGKGPLGGIKERAFPMLFSMLRIYRCPWSIHIHVTT
jgi:hypothetical protein